MDAGALALELDDDHPAILPVAMPVTRRGSRAQSFSILANGEVIRSVWAPKSTVTP